MEQGVSIIIPTYNGGDIFAKCIEAINRQKYDGKIQLIVIDSESTDKTREIALAAGAQVIKIKQKEFHHAGTRNLALQSAIYQDVILLVQDAIPISDKWLKKIIYSINTDDVIAVYGQQVPHDHADIYAKFTVKYHTFHLGDVPIVKSIDSIAKFDKLTYDQALHLARFDNVCAIYKRDILLANPFPDVLFSEDLAWALSVLKDGYKVKYDPTIKVVHSHNRGADYHLRRSLVENITCADILKKEKEDMSLWKANDLHVLINAMKEIDEVKNEDFYYIYNSLQSVWLSRMVSKLIQISRKFKVSVHRAVADYYFTAMLRANVGHRMGLLKYYFPDLQADEVNLCAKNFLAAIVGSYMGRVYASYKLRGYIPPEIQEAIEPYLGGV